MEHLSTVLSLMFPASAPSSPVVIFSFGQAALQAIAFLQKLYGFVVVDYNFQGVLLYSEVARSAVSVVATAAGILGRVARGRKDLLIQS